MDGDFIKQLYFEEKAVCLMFDGPTCEYNRRRPTTRFPAGFSIINSEFEYSMICYKDSEV